MRTAATAAAAAADAAAAARRAPPARRLRFDIIHRSSNCTRERCSMRAGGSTTAANAVLLRMRHSATLATRVRVSNFDLAVRGVSAAAVGAVGAAGTSAICSWLSPLLPLPSQKTHCASGERQSRAHRRQHRRLHRPRPPPGFRPRVADLNGVTTRSSPFTSAAPRAMLVRVRCYEYRTEPVSRK